MMIRYPMAIPLYPLRLKVLFLFLHLYITRNAYVYIYPTINRYSDVPKLELIEWR